MPRLRLALTIASIASIASLALAAVAGCRSGSIDLRPQVVLVVLIDTLRTDHVGVYAGGHDLTPALDDLARRSYVFADAIAPSSWTRSTVASLFTSRYPGSIRVLDREDSLAEDYLTLAEVLKAEGWATVAISTNANAGAHFGFAQGFDEFRTPELERGYPNDFKMQVAQGVSEEAARVLRRRRAEAAPRPLFLFLHYTDPHDPYLPHGDLIEPADLPGRFSGSRPDLESMDRLDVERLTEEDRRRIRHLYAGEVRYCDLWVGRLLAELEATGHDDETLVVVTADHGEGLWDHGFRTHGVDLHEEQIRVPLLLHLPGMTPAEARWLREPVTLLDLAPTLLRALGVDVPGTFHGRDLLAGLQDPPPESHRLLYSELTLDGRDFEMVRQGSLKLIHRRGDRDGPGRRRDAGDGAWKYHLYDLATDPGERVDLLNEKALQPVQRRLMAALEEWSRTNRRQLGPGRRVDLDKLDEKTRKSLEALGYL